MSQRPTYAEKRTAALAAWAGVLGLTLLATALHLWRLDAKSIWWDESLSLFRAQRDVGYILSNHIDFRGAETVDLHPPLYFMFLRIFVVLWGESDLVLRLPSVLCASLIVPLLYWLGYELKTRRAGLIAAALGALSPFYLWYAQEVRMYTMATLLCLCAAVCLVRFFATRRWGWMVGFGLLGAASVWTQYLCALVIAGQMAYIPFRAGTDRVTAAIAHIWRKSWARWATGVALGIVLVLLGMVVRTAWGVAWSAQEVLRYVPLPLILRDALNSYSLGLTVSVVKVWPLLALFGGAYVAGVVSPRRRLEETRREVIGARALLLCYVFALPLGIWAYSLIKSIYMGSRYVIMGSPAFYIGVAAGIDWLLGERNDRRWRKIAGTLLLVALCVGMLYSNGRYFFHHRYTTKEDHRSTAEHISARQQPGDLIVINAPENRPAFEHYYLPLGGQYDETTIVGMPTVALHPNYDVEQMGHDMLAALQGHDRVWIAHCRTQHSDPDNRVLGWLHDHVWRLSTRIYPSWGSSPLVELYRVEPHRRPGVRPAENPILTMGGALSLEDVALYARCDGAALAAAQETETASGVLGLSWDQPVDAGSYLSGDLTWTTLQDVDDLKAALTLRDERGLVWAQNDSRLLGYTFSEAYDADTRIIQDVWLRLPDGLPEATYTWELLIYQAVTGENLERDNHQGFGHPYIVQLAKFDVQRSEDAWEMPEDDALAPLAGKPAFGPTDLVAASVGPGRIAAGEQVSLSVVWRARKASDVDAVMLINWVDSRGNAWRSDSFPLAGLNDPRSAWEEGEMVRGLVTLPTPEDAPAGEHTLHLLVHNPDEDAFYWRRWLGALPISRDIELATVVIE